jgi:hypothetical protein
VRLLSRDGATFSCPLTLDVVIAMEIRVCQQLHIPYIGLVCRILVLCRLEKAASVREPMADQDMVIESLIDRNTRSVEFHCEAVI